MIDAYFRSIELHLLARGVPFRSPADDEPLEFMIRDRRYSARYEDFPAKADCRGDDAIMRANIGYEPLQEILYNLMSRETFATQRGRAARPRGRSSR